jgi:hypothetical protein
MSEPPERGKAAALPSIDSARPPDDDDTTSAEPEACTAETLAELVSQLQTGTLTVTCRVARVVTPHPCAGPRLQRPTNSSADIIAHPLLATPGAGLSQVQELAAFATAMKRLTAPLLATPDAGLGAVLEGNAPLQYLLKVTSLSFQTPSRQLCSPYLPYFTFYHSP